MVAELIREKGWNKKRFCDKTLLDEFVYARAMSNHKSTPNTRTILAICVGMDLSLTTTDTLLGASGFRLNNSKEHLAFKFILRDMAGLPIEVRNAFLVSIGVEPLGSKNNPDIRTIS
jgi:hypothetical protein